MSNLLFRQKSLSEIFVNEDNPSTMEDDSLLFLTNISPYAFSQGSFPTCFLLSVLSGLSYHHCFLKRLFKLSGELIVVNFWRSHGWEGIYVDDLFDCSCNNNTEQREVFTPLGCRSVNLKSSWSMLLEKAYISMFYGGDYTKVKHGQDFEAMLDLTSSPSIKGIIGDQELSALVGSLNQITHCVLTVTTCPKETDNQNAEGGISDAQLRQSSLVYDVHGNEVSLLREHSYAVLGFDALTKIVKLR
jgi:hypothetical protein